MPIALVCPNPECRRSINAPAKTRGRKVRCPACGTGFVAAETLLPGVETQPGEVARPSAPPVPPRAGSDPAEIGRFKVKAKLGAGAFGTVYRAYDPQLDREVALKVPHAGSLTAPGRVERFLREAKAAANLRHPNIVPVYDAGQSEGRYYIAGAFIDGRPLSKRIDGTRVSFELAAEFTRQLADALAYAHSQGVVHRDVKPDNILVDTSDQIHLTDFGLAVRADEDARLTTDGALLGTPAYMAPEQAAGKSSEAGPAADQYSVGVVLYELLTGHIPFTGPLLTLLHSIQFVNPQAPRVDRPDVPRDLETVCLKALAKRPEDRYSDCSALAEDLRRWLAGEPVTARRLGTRERFVRWVKREPKLAASLAATVVALIATAVVATTAAIYTAQLARAADAGANAARIAQQDAETSRAEADAQRAEADAQRKEAETKAIAADAARRESDTLRVRADQETAKARDAEEEAKKKQEQLQTALDKAEKADKGKKTAEMTAEQITAEATKLAERLKKLEYVVPLARAFESLKAGKLDEARILLDACNKDRRGWEWRFLRGWLENGKPPVTTAFLPLNMNFPTSIQSYWPSANGRQILFELKDGQVAIYDVDKQVALPKIKLRGGDKLMDVDAELRRFVTARPALGLTRAGPPRVKSLMTWDVRGRKPLFSGPPGAWDGLFHDVALSRNGLGLACLGSSLAGPNITVYDAATGKVQVPTFAAAGGQFIRFTAKQEGVYTYERTRGQVVSYDQNRREPVFLGVRCPDFLIPSPDLGLMLHRDGTASREGRNAGVFSVLPKADEEKVYKGPAADREIFEDGLRSAYWTPDGTRVIVLPKRGDRDLRVHDAASGELLFRYPDWFTDTFEPGRHRVEFERISFVSADGTRILSADNQSPVIQVWTIPAEVK